MTAAALQVAIFSDYVCPYCYLGAGLVDRLRREAGLELEVTWLPFELHPGTPAQGRPLTDLFRQPEATIRCVHQDLKARAAELGLPMEPPLVLYNTRAAHLLAEYARDQGRGDAVHRECFRMNFVEGRNLADLDVLREVARRSGLDPEAALAALSDPVYEERLQWSAQQAAAAGVTGVPTFIVNGRWRIVGAHPYPQMLAAFRRIQEEAKEQAPGEH